MAWKRQLSAWEIFYKSDNIHPGACFVLLSPLPLLVVMVKIARLLEENESVAAHHGLCSQNSAQAPRGTSSSPMPLTAFELFGGQAEDWGSREERGTLLSMRLPWKGLLKPMGLPWAPVADGSCPCRQIRSCVCALGSALRSRGVARGDPAASGGCFFSCLLLLDSEGAMWSGLKASFSPLRKALPLVIPRGRFNID